MLRNILCVFLVTFFIIPNVNSEISNFYNPTLIDNNKEFCKKNYNKFSNNKILLNEINYLSIDINNQRKWFKNLFNTIIWDGINTPSKFKKNFKAKLVVNFKENFTCEFKAKVRIHGDAKDHLKNTMNGDPYASLHISLIEDNIDSIIKFILFIPATRNYDNEIFSSTLFKNLGFLAPRTKYIDTYVNGIKIKYIFQEKIAKEMIENNGFIEGPIIEASQRFFWPEEKVNYVNSSLVQGRVSNQKWSTKNKYNLKKTTLALTKFNEGVIDDGSIHFNTNRLSYKNKMAQKENNEYQAIMSALGGFHGLVPTNTKYYYDPINLGFKPIYYDGNVNILTNNSNNSIYKYPELFTYHSKVGAITAINKIENLNADIFNRELKKNGLDIPINEIQSLKNKLIKRLKYISKIEVQEKGFNFKKVYFSRHKKGNEDKRLVFIDDDLNELKVCEFEVNKCDFENLNLKEIERLLSGRLKKNGKFYIFASNNYDNYLNGNFFDTSLIISNKFKKQKLEDTEILYSKNIGLLIDNESKKIHFIQNDNEQVVLFKNGSLKDWEINFEGRKTNNLKNVENFFSGCMNFNEVKLHDVKIFIKDAMCNDAINFINSKGKISSLIVNGAQTDAIDFDFSNLEIDYINVSNALNDCVDMSYGNYSIKNQLLQNCGDKAISVGENSVFSGNKIEIENSLIGIATKDNSISKIENIKINNSNICAAAYRKKQEFYGSEIFINNFKCTESKIYFQNGSKIEIINEL